MGKKAIWLFVIVTVCLGLFLYFKQGAAPQAGAKNQAHQTQQNGSGSGSSPTAQDIRQLKNTDNFRPNALQHILEGEVNKAGKATGFHYEGLPSAKGRVIPGTQSPVNQLGVYKAKVQVEGKAKEDNGGESTFFPKAWSAQQVVDAINEAYAKRVHRTGNIYAGETSKGMRINMYIDEGTGKIISAFPQY